MRHRAGVFVYALVSALVAGAALGAPAEADLSSVDGIAEALDLAGDVVEAVRFTGDEAGADIRTDSLAGFPTTGSSYVVLSTGRASDISLPDTEEDRSTDLGGPAGAAGEDQVQVQLQLDPPAGATCLTFDFRFLSEEFPEYVGSEFNDTFTAEIVDTDLRYENGTIVTPYNFAYDTQGNPISINTVFGVSAEDETTYDGSTPVLQAVTPAELNDAEDVLVTLTIQDVGDSIYDSAVALDNFRWSSTEPCTPGASIQDTDGDALPDDWEENGLDVDGDGSVDVDLPAMGADPMRKDVFVEVDWMHSEPTCIWFICWGDDVDFEPSPAALRAVVEAFADAPVDNPDGSTGISLHIDAGEDSVLDHSTGATWGALGRGSRVGHQANLGGSTSIDGTFVNCAGDAQTYSSAYDWSAFDGIKQPNFDDDRRDVFHYAIYANRYNGGNSSGISRGIVGSDFIVSQGAFNDGAGFTLRQERGTLMHEFGHNLGLRHGGDDNCNQEPNYLSIMSYSFQFPGLRAGGVDGRLDYSRTRLANLDEGDLDETRGLDPDGAVGQLGTRYWCGSSERVVNNAAGAIDWDCSGDANGTAVAADVNADGTRLILDGHDDWTAVRFDGGAIGAFGDDEQPAATRDDELTLDLAEELGVLTGDFDALLDGPASAVLIAGTGNRHVDLGLRNVGRLDDRYALTVTSDLPGLGGPAAVEVPAGGNGKLRFEVDTSQLPPGEYTLRIEAESLGTQALVAEHAMTITVPDLNDPAVREQAQQALARLEDLGPGEGPPADVLAQLLEMLRAALKPTTEVLGPRVLRLGGKDRIATAVAISADSFAAGEADMVVLARSDVFADALTATPLAVDENAPLLITPPGDLDGRVAAELQRVLAKGRTVLFVGGSEALQPSVAAQVEALGYRVERHAGSDRFGTAVAIAERLGNPERLLLASGLDFADAVTAGAAAGHIGGAVLLTAGDAMAGPTAAYLADSDAETRYAVGGPAARADASATPLVGSNRFRTALTVAEQLFDAPPVVGIATGERFPDALTGGAYVSARGGPMLLSPITTLPDEVADYLEAGEASIQLAYLFGGTAALGTEVEQLVSAALPEDD